MLGSQRPLGRTLSSPQPRGRRRGRRGISYRGSAILTGGLYNILFNFSDIVISMSADILRDRSLPSQWFSTQDPSSFQSFLSQSDVILISLPSTTATHKILNATTIAHLKPSTVIVNVGRGTTIDTNALVAALNEGRIAGASLDVTDPEPLPHGHTLYGRKNVIITPHLSG